MKVIIDENDVLVVCPESSIELYAIKKWCEDNDYDKRKTEFDKAKISILREAVRFHN